MHTIFTKRLVQGVHFILTRHDTVINIRKIIGSCTGMVTDFGLRKMNINLLKPSGQYMYHQF